MDQSGFLLDHAAQLVDQVGHLRDRRFRFRGFCHRGHEAGIP
jgi:hypothetical protein